MCEEYVYQNSSDKRKKIKQKFRVNNLVGTTDIKNSLKKIWYN